MLQALHQRVLHKTFQELTPPIPYIPKSLAWSVKGHGLPQLALTASLPMAMDTRAESSYLHTSSGLVHSLLDLEVCCCLHVTFSPILTLVCLADFDPIFRTHLQHIFPRDALLTPKGQESPTIFCFEPCNPPHRSSVPYFLSYSLSPCLLGFSILNTNSQSHRIPYNECQENNLTKQKLNTKTNTKVFTNCIS